jgi:hypothetical protein
MTRFIPPSLKQPLVNAARVLYDFAEIEFEEYLNLHEADLDLDTDGEDTEITEDSEFTFHPGSDDAVSLRARDVIALAEEIPKSRLLNNLEYIAPTRAFVRVAPSTHAASAFAAHIAYAGERTDVAIRAFQHSQHEITFALVDGFTPFALHVLHEGDYEEDYYPAVAPDELFIEVTYPEGTPEATWRELCPAYLFEIEQQTEMGFLPTPRTPLGKEPFDYDETREYVELTRRARLRPLMSGPGVANLLALYERAVGRNEDPEQHFVGFVKVLEYVSATVVNAERNAQVRMRLLSPRALAPDAGFISELSDLFESLRSFKSDAQALRLTIEVCCDLVELAKLAPPKLRALAVITAASAVPDRKKAIDGLSAMLSATRNAFSHAKANYNPTGDECPDGELQALIECVRVAAHQAIRWFASSDVTLRKH